MFYWLYRWVWHASHPSFHQSLFWTGKLMIVCMLLLILCFHLIYELLSIENWKSPDLLSILWLSYLHWETTEQLKETNCGPCWYLTPLQPAEPTECRAPGNCPVQFSEKCVRMKGCCRDNISRESSDQRVTAANNSKSIAHFNFGSYKSQTSLPLHDVLCKKGFFSFF